jgi:YHS domain-containing protein
MVPIADESQRLLKRRPTVTQDPVCGMDVQPEQSAGQSEYKGQTYYFCCPVCKQKFDQEPQRYADSQQAMTAKS